MHGLDLFEIILNNMKLINFSPNFRHKACNIFARTFCEYWLQEENVGQEVMIEDLTVNFAHFYIEN